MKKFLYCALIGAAFALPAQAQTVSAGTYDVEGTNLDGSSYGGTAVIKLTSETTCSIEWTTGDASKPSSAGICMLHNDAFAVGYVLEDSVGLGVYTVKRGGVLDGTWTLSGEDGSGAEKLTLQK